MHHCPKCGELLGTSLTSCQICGWAKLAYDQMPVKSLPQPRYEFQKIRVDFGQTTEEQSNG